VVVMDNPLEAMAYATLNPAEETTLFLAGHEGGWLPGDKLHRVDVVVGSNAEFHNLPGQVEYELPQSESWGEDLQIYLAGVMELEELEMSSQFISVPCTINLDYEEEEKEEKQHQYRGLSM
jgi:hypothetical protein